MAQIGKDGWVASSLPSWALNMMGFDWTRFAIMLGLHLKLNIENTKGLLQH
jgi:hypothetical protein